MFLENTLFYVLKGARTPKAEKPRESYPFGSFACFEGMGCGLEYTDTKPMGSLLLP